MSLSSMKNMVKLSFGEEVGNTISHGVMSVLCLFLLPACSVYSYLKGGWIQSLGVSIFIICLFLMFLASTLYHAMDFNSKQKLVFRILDHSCIYLAIAGTYTPISLCLIKGWEGLIILVIQWSMVLIGILYKALAKKSMPKLSLIIYLTMGWVAVLFLPALFKTANLTFLSLIVLGGIFYSIGTYFYSKPKKPYYHMIWHIFIDFASISHFIAILFFM